MADVLQVAGVALPCAVCNDLSGMAGARVEPAQALMHE
jgi:hypothetical protein